MDNIIKIDCEESLYVNEELPEIIKHIGRVVESVGCAEIQIVMLDHDMTPVIFGTQERSNCGVGALSTAHADYNQEYRELRDET